MNDRAFVETITGGLNLHGLLFLKADPVTVQPVSFSERKVCGYLKKVCAVHAIRP